MSADFWGTFYGYYDAFNFPCKTADVLIVPFFQLFAYKVYFVHTVRKCL